MAWSVLVFWLNASAIHRLPLVLIPKRLDVGGGFHCCLHHYRTAVRPQWRAIKPLAVQFCRWNAAFWLGFALCKVYAKRFFAHLWSNVYSLAAPHSVWQQPLFHVALRAYVCVFGRCQLCQAAFVLEHALSQIHFGNSKNFRLVGRYIGSTVYLAPHYTKNNYPYIARWRLLDGAVALHHCFRLRGVVVQGNNEACAFTKIVK